MSILRRIEQESTLRSAIQDADKNSKETAQEAENNESNWEYIPGANSFKNKITETVITDDEYQERFGAFTTSKTNHVGE